MMKIANKLVGDCSSHESALSIITQTIDILHHRFISISNILFAIDLHRYTFLLLQVQQAGSFIEEACFSYFLKLFTLPKDEKKMANSSWLFELVTSLLVNQFLSFQLVIRDIIIPLLRNPDLFNGNGKAALFAASNWVLVLETLCLQKKSPFLPDHIYHLEVFFIFISFLFFSDINRLRPCKKVYYQVKKLLLLYFLYLSAFKN